MRPAVVAALRVGALDLTKRRITVSAAVVEVDGTGLV
jgi:hypothetical protein